MAREFLVVYDYGTGGVWAYLSAASVEQIAEQYPEFTVVEERPAWLTQEEEHRIRERMTIDIEDEDHFFLTVLREGRKGDR